MTAGYRQARIAAFLSPGDRGPARAAATRPPRRCTRWPTAACSAWGWARAGPSGSYLPNAHNDFIFAIIGEELGFLGAFAVLALFATLAYTGLRIAARTVDPWLRIVVATSTTWLVAQAAINIGYVVGAAAGDRASAAADLLRRNLARGHHVHLRGAGQRGPARAGGRRDPRAAPGPANAIGRVLRIPPPQPYRGPRAHAGRRGAGPVTVSVVVAGGGTAGHIEPAMALADAVRRLRPDAVVTALGTESGLDTRLIPRAATPSS